MSRPFGVLMDGPHAKCSLCDCGDASVLHHPVPGMFFPQGMNSQTILSARVVFRSCLVSLLPLPDLSTMFWRWRIGQKNSVPWSKNYNSMAFAH